MKHNIRDFRFNFPWQRLKSLQVSGFRLQVLRRKGFTLIELLVVIAIIGLIASLITVSFSGQRQRARIAKTLEFNQSLHNALGSEAVGVWDFDEGSGTTARDGSGHGNNGTINGAVYDCTDTPYHVVGQGSGKCALSFDGNDYVEVLRSSSLAVDGILRTNYSVALWFKADVDNRGIFAVLAGAGGVGGHDRHIYLSNGNICQRVWSDETICTSGKNFADGNWHHVVQVVESGVGQRVYVDGKEEASGSKDKSDFNWADRLWIGFSNDAASDYFSGLIDEVRVYSKPLSIGQIRQLYAEGLPYHQSVALNPKP